MSDEVKPGLPPPGEWTPKRLAEHYVKLAHHCEQRSQFGAAGNFRIAANVILWLAHPGKEDARIAWIRTAAMADIPVRGADPEMTSDAYPMRGPHALTDQEVATHLKAAMHGQMMRAGMAEPPITTPASGLQPAPASIPARRELKPPGAEVKAPAPMMPAAPPPARRAPPPAAALPSKPKGFFK
jgi:hypothetical protein